MRRVSFALLDHSTKSLAHGIAVLLAIGIGGYALAQQLKKWQFQSRIEEFWRDGEITGSERKELESLAGYLGVEKDRAALWETEITGKTASSGGNGSGSAAVHKSIESIRTDLMDGRFTSARKGMATLMSEHPDLGEVKALSDELERPVRSRIEAKLLGRASGQHVLNAQSALLGLTGNEVGFRLNVEAHEPIYLYVLRVGRTSGTEVLFPRTAGANPLPAEEVRWLPSEKPHETYTLPTKMDDDEGLIIVSSRWPAQDIERQLRLLDGAGRAEASSGIRAALQERQASPLGGCDVRSLKFSREAAK